MRLIVIETEAYFATEKVFKEIVKKDKEIKDKGYYSESESESDMLSFLDTRMKKLKRIGEIEFDFRI